MSRIITLTLNPSVDKSTRIAGLQPDRKLRCSAPIYEPGGGGVNVSRAIRKLGGTSECVYLAGGARGALLRDLLDQEAIVQHVVPTQGETRENFMVVDTLTEQQYRFVMDGPTHSEAEWRESLAVLASRVAAGDYVVASGSLSSGVPTDYYAQVVKIVQQKKAKIIVDTSGEALQRATETGVYLLKPNLGELSSLTSQEAITAPDQERLAHQLIEQGRAKLVVVSLGAQGALLMTDQGVEYVTAPTVHKRSTVGAGDSMVAGMVLRLAQDASPLEAVRYGVACGTAATMNYGTQLCRKEDVDRLYQWMVQSA
ncbi:MAG: 1-phosphofructokinase family hexose kinase [Tunicatimonas sp.]